MKQFCIDESGDTGHTSKSSKYFVLTKMSKLSVECVACVLEKRSNGVEDLYLKATNILADYFANKDVELVIVSRKDNRKSYSEKIMKVYDSREIKASFSDPAKDKSLQIADFYSWSIFVNFEKLDNNYFDKLENLTLLH